jgi:ABC-type nitrate/sulfonate/bicarbonate transport system substrate-binding protein
MTDKKLSRPILWTVAITIVFVLAAIAKVSILDQNKEESQRAAGALKVGYTRFTLNIPVIAADQRRAFAKEDEIREFELIPFPNTNALRDAFLAKQIDIAVSLPTELIVERNRVDPGAVKIILVNILTTARPIDAFIVRTDSGITDLTELRGLRVATIPADSMVVYGSMIARKVGIEFAAGSPMKLPADQILQALQTKSVDALFLIEPMVNAARNSGFKVIESGSIARHLKKELAVGAHVVLRETYATKKLAVEAYQRAVSESAFEANKDPADALQRFDQALGLALNSNKGVALPEWRSACLFRTDGAITGVLKTPNSPITGKQAFDDLIEIFTEAKFMPAKYQFRDEDFVCGMQR